MNMKTILSAELRRALRYVSARLLLRSAALLVILLVPTVPALANGVQIDLNSFVLGGLPPARFSQIVFDAGAQSLGPVSRTCGEGNCTATGFGFAGNGGSFMKLSATASTVAGILQGQFAGAGVETRGDDRLTFSSTGAAAGAGGTVAAQIVISGATIRSGQAFETHLGYQLFARTGSGNNLPVLVILREANPHVSFPPENDVDVVGEGYGRYDISIPVVLGESTELTWFANALADTNDNSEASVTPTICWNGIQDFTVGGVSVPYSVSSASGFDYRFAIPNCDPTRDTTAPVLTLPASFAVDATSPAGAIVNYTVTASDNSGAAPTVSCIPPSGATFANGPTTVNCTATDAAGNSTPGSFTVTVNGPVAQLSNLISIVGNFNNPFGITNSLDTKLQNAIDALSAMKGGNASSACNSLGAFINEAQAQSGKKLTAAQANLLIASANQIRAAQGCP